MLNFQILDSANAYDRKTWIELWERWPDREVFAHPDYVGLYGAPHVKSLCAAAVSGQVSLLYPFLLRSVGAEPWCDVSLRDCTDIASPYGYGGPFWWGAAWDPNAAVLFWGHFGEWAARARVVSEVVRLSIFPETIAEYPGERRHVLDNVVRSLGQESELWQDFEHKVRKNVNRARSCGVTVEVDPSGARLDNFLAIYRSTMDRRNADPNYYFPRDYFERLNTYLRDQVAWFHAFSGGRLISTELVLVSANRIYSFLGGTDASWFHMRPNDLLKFEIMNWARDAGKKQFVLGGGYGRGDGIYRYKLSFAPAGSVPFSLGTRILDGPAYAGLVSAHRNFAMAQGSRWEPAAEYFPAYRG
jgi:hypothetical protein